MDFCNKDRDWQQHMCAVNMSYGSLPPQVWRRGRSRHGHNVYLRRAQFCMLRDFYIKLQMKVQNNKMC
jgi:hypothetical protein